MNNLVVINEFFVTEVSRQVLREGLSSLDLVRQLAPRLPEVGQVLTFTRQDGSSLADLGAWLEAHAAGFDHIFHLWADAPFYRLDLLLKQWEAHLRYRAEYSFADGFPLGLAGEILAQRAVAPVAKLAVGQSGPIVRDVWFTLISRDINAFDIETELSPIDLRSLRLSFTTDSRRNFLLCQRHLAAAAGDLEAFLVQLRDQPAPQRTLPAYIQIQASQSLPQIPIYSPWASRRAERQTQVAQLAPEALIELLGRLRAWLGDAVVCPSLWGEPATYPAWPQVLAAVADWTDLSWVIETSGLGWPAAAIEAFAQHFPGRVDWIVELDATSSETYQRVRGEGWTEAVAFTDSLISRFPGHVYPQAMRMHDTEAEMETFYRHWKERAGQAIIQKYNWFSARLPDLKVADLSPYRRPVCWHLKRDLTILVDGSVVSCRDDYDQTRHWGNALSEDLPAIWERGQTLHQAQLGGTYPDLCGRCDEHYTYNF